MTRRSQLPPDAALVLQNEDYRDRRRKRPAQMKRRTPQAAMVGVNPRKLDPASPKAPWNRLWEPMRLYCCDSVRAILDKPRRSVRDARDTGEGGVG